VVLAGSCCHRLSHQTDAPTALGVPRLLGQVVIGIEFRC